MNSSVEEKMEELFGEEEEEDHGDEDTESSNGEGPESGTNHKKAHINTVGLGKLGKVFPITTASPAAAAAGLAHVIELGKGTEGRCGACRGCQRDACGACSLCRRGRFEDCIDKFCSEEETGRLKRAHMKELYLKNRKKSLEGGRTSIFDVRKLFGFIESLPLIVPTNNGSIQVLAGPILQCLEKILKMVQPAYWFKF